MFSVLFYHVQIAQLKVDIVNNIPSEREYYSSSNCQIKTGFYLKKNTYVTIYFCVWH